MQAGGSENIKTSLEEFLFYRFAGRNQKQLEKKRTEEKRQSEKKETTNKDFF